MSNPRYAVIDLGETQADIRQTLRAMATGSTELVSDNGNVHVSVLIAGFLRQVNAPSPYTRYALELLEEKETK